MKKHRIMGIGLVLTLLVSLIAMAIPTAAAPPGDGNWIKQSQPGPSAFVIDTNAAVNDFDIAESSGRVYFVDTGQDKLKTGTSGTVWSSLDNLVGMVPAITLSLVAVSPDNDQAIAVADAVAGVVYISNDGGVNWSTLPVLPGTGTITDLDVGPARTGSLLGREYLVTMADPAAGTTAKGDVLVIGQTASWISLAGVTGVADFMFGRFSPLYIGDRVVMAGGVTAAGAVSVWVLNVATNANVSYSPVTVYSGGVDYQGGAAGSLGLMDIAMPSDFDPTSSSFMRAWVSTGHVGGNANDDIYRISGVGSKDLNAVTTVQAIDSVGYAGTYDAGTLFAGYTSTTCVVKYTDQPASNTPTWTTSRNAPTGNGYVSVRPALDFASSDKVFAGTTGWQAAWSISENGGISFYARSAINNGANDWGDIESLVPLPDGSGFWVLTDNGTDLEIWYTPNPPSSMSALRYEVLLGSGDGVLGNAKLLINPDWAAAPSIFVHDMASGQLYISSNGGDTWITRYVPANTDVLVVVDSTTLYAFEGTNFHKSTNMGWTWEPPIAWSTSGTATDVVVADDGTIFAGYSSGNVRKSTNGGASWSTAVTYGGISNDVFLVVDPGYDSNGYLYIADMTTGQVMRSDPATNTWRSLGFPGGAAVGMQMVDGVLYVADANGVWVNNTPTSSLSFVPFAWKQANAGDTGFIPAQGFAALSGSSVHLFVIAGGSDKDAIYGYIDYISAAKTTVTAPTMVPVDPVTGYAAPFQLTWTSIGTGLGASNSYDIRIYDAATNQRLDAGISSASATYQVTGASTGVALEAGKSYNFRVRAKGQSGGDDLLSLWSADATVKVASGSRVEQPYTSPQILGPAGGATTSQNPGFAWAPVTEATEYEFVLATDSALTKTVAGTPVKLTTPSFQASGLNYGTTYFWGVMVTKPNPGPRTVSTFTVMDEPAPPAPAPTTTIEVPPQPTPTVIVTAPPAPAPTEPAIPAVAIWVVIGVGAVLIIVIIVLIVRTRRPV